MNGSLINGGSLAAVFPYNLTLTAGVPVNIEVADHNAIGTWDLNVLTASGPAISQLPGVSFYAASPSAAPEVPESSSLLLLGLGLGGLLLTARRRRRAS